MAVKTVTPHREGSPVLQCRTMYLLRLYKSGKDQRD